MGDWFTLLGYEGQLATWIGASFLLYVLAYQLAWQSQWIFLSTHEPERSDALGRLVDQLYHERATHWIIEILQFIYYLGLPFLASISGLLRADLLGISGTDWVEGKNLQGFLWEDWARGIGLAVTLTLAIWGVWYASRLLARQYGLQPLSSLSRGPTWRWLRNICYDQVHWAFYRSGPMLWLGDPYWGAFAGLALVLIEAGLDPANWWALKEPGTAAPVLVRLGIVWISTWLFLATNNLWLLFLTHFMITILLSWSRSDGREPTRRPAV